MYSTLSLCDLLSLFLNCFRLLVVLFLDLLLTVQGVLSWSYQLISLFLLSRFHRNYWLSRPPQVFQICFFRLISNISFMPLSLCVLIFKGFCFWSLLFSFCFWRLRLLFSALLMFYSSSMSFLPVCDHFLCQPLWSLRNLSLFLFGYTRQNQSGFLFLHLVTTKSSICFWLLKQRVCYD